MGIEFIKVKFSRHRPGVTQSVGRDIALLFNDRGTRRGWVISSTPRPHLTPGKDLVTILQEAGWAPGPVWTGGKFRPHRHSIPNRPARSQSLYRLSYPTHVLNLRYSELHSRSYGAPRLALSKEFNDPYSALMLVWVYIYCTHKTTFHELFVHWQRLLIQTLTLINFYDWGVTKCDVESLFERFPTLQKKALSSFPGECLPFGAFDPLVYVPSKRRRTPHLITQRHIPQKRSPDLPQCENLRTSIIKSWRKWSNQ